MKTFAKNDYYIQFYILIAGLVSIIIGLELGYGIFLFYFVVGIPQLISFFIRAFQETKKSLRYIIYGFFIMPVWISWLAVLGFNNNNDVTNFFGYILVASVFYSPLLAILYVYDTYRVYKSQK
ncbi:hypothetical protein QFZ37_003506 [Chryseobacterium ginsenosidimutans]|uniref:hypothetical protein n=1 Tax=Chryseobacterium ginsenosidimutans TaxID=687846 RepID=UPI002788F48B|nr:hypothetical protein [Chryseobacterium ginsenosidimutans]MDQ0595137.1 hypothetical protein [Chryseobacterium ginsenosidimutans]